MKKMCKKLLSLLLVFCMMTSLLPTASATDNNPSPEESGITISADATNTVTIKEEEPEPDPEPEPGPVVGGTLQFSTLNFTIQRDYEQSCMITVRNTSNETKEFYLETVNGYDDLSMEIIKSGSKKSPAIIAAGETIQVELTVFAQNAEEEQYTIPITAYILSDGDYIEDAKNNVRLTCDLPYLDLAWTLLSSNDSTLKQTYRITNQGDTLTDLSVKASDSVEDYLSFSPIISNYELRTGASIEFEVWPDLAKMKSNNVGLLSGNLVASCAGKTSEQECVFDTKGQEITVTTMGQLALQQDGNPFSKFEVINDSVSIQYEEAGQIYAISEDTTIDDLLDENNLFNLSYQSAVDLGVDTTAQMEFTTKSSTITTEEIDSLDLDPKIVESDDGSISVTIYTVLTSDEYQNIINGASAGASKVRAVATMRAVDDPVEEADRFLLETTFKINDAAGLWNHDIPVIGTFGGVYDVLTVCEEGFETFEIASDPRLDSNTKTAYYAGFVGKALTTTLGYVLTALNPVAGLMFSVVADLTIKNWFEDAQNTMLDDAYAKYQALYGTYAGHQCTNRGKITVPFYVPEYNTSGDSKPTMHTTGRMYGDGYVDRNDTNYDITLNGEPVGTVSNTGLTDVTMAEIPTDGLKPGEVNTVEFDYDTNPGSHFVSTDTQITLLYPNDTEIGYIGEPDDLQDVRTKPDFCVYPENIYAPDDLIIGEESNLLFNVYNRGSHGGWFTVTCYEGSNILFSEENYYLAAFSSHTFEMAWTPSAEQNTIRVELTNTSVGLDERSLENNSATATVTARQRAIPDIHALNIGTVYENTPFSVTVDVYNYFDISSADFTLDGTIVPSEVRSSDYSGYRRYWLSFDEGLPAGSHSINTAVTYKTSSGNAVVNEALPFNIQEEVWIVPSAYIYSNTFMHGEKMEFSVTGIENLSRVEVSIDGGNSFIAIPDSSYSDENQYSVDLTNNSAGELNVLIKMYYFDRDNTETVEEYTETITLISEANSYYTLSLADNISSPNFSVYRYSYNIGCEFEQVSGGNYRCLKTIDMVNNPDRYTVVISYDSGIIVTSMSENGQTISDTGCHQLTIQKPENAEVSSAVITRISDIGSSSCYVDIPVSPNIPIMLSPGRYTVEIKGVVDGIPFSNTVEKNLTSSNQVINVNDLVLIYYFEILNPDSDGYDATLYYRNSGDSYWSTGYLNLIFDTDTNILKCSNSYSWVVSEMAECDEAYVLIHSKKEIYFVQVKETTQNVPMLMAVEADQDTDYIQLDKSSLNRVSLVCDNADWSVGNVTVQWNDLAVDLYGDTLYIPDGDYNFSTILFSENRTLISNTEATVTDNCELKVDQDLSNFRDVTISWPNPFATTGTVQCSTESGSNVIAHDFASGNNFKAEDGDRTFYLELMYLDDEFTITRDFEVSEENHQLTISNQFSGSIDSYFYSEYVAGDTISVSISDAFDEYGNCLSRVYAYDIPLHGTAIFTDINDQGKKFFTPITATSLNGIDVILPEVAGTYSLSIELTTNGDGSYYTVAFDSQGGSPVASSIVGSGETVLKPNNPTRPNYTFAGWYTSAEYTQLYDFNTPVTNNITLYAKWLYNESHTSSSDNSPSYSTEISDDINNGTITVRPKNASPGKTVTITAIPNDGYELDKLIVLDAQGNKLSVTKVSNTQYTFTMPRSRVTVETSFVEINEKNVDGLTFADVSASAYYYDAVYWAVANGITSGTSAITFSPETSCNRAQMVTFLWRAAGSPAPERTNTQFTDVASSTYYYDAVLWAIEQGITSGTSATTFSPDTTCTRAQAVSFLYRFAGSPEVNNGNVFTDIDMNAYYASAVQWAVSDGVTVGTSSATFSPDVDCTRAQIMTFLYRLSLYSYIR